MRFNRVLYVLDAILNESRINGNKAKLTNLDCCVLFEIKLFVQ